ncbi:TPA: DUF192 domain-containing protein [Pseudomonas aeruginosa]|nr:DUF192 domain-containing protein [Pseudomonas aeruginosa]HBN8980259.1 DUF192 domain-containing protein [Pseudomonas aeruginosa]
MSRHSGAAAFPHPARKGGRGRRATSWPGRAWAALAALIACGLAVAFAVGRQQAHAAQPEEACDLHFSNGTTLARVPVAKTVEQQARGLAKRDDVGRGMLFTWAKVEPRVFWMRDTRVPLSIGFFDDTGLLFAIEDMQPETDDYHFSIKPASDALELARGQFQAHGLKEGVRLTGRTCSPL